LARPGIFFDVQETVVPRYRGGKDAIRVGVEVANVFDQVVLARGVDHEDAGAVGHGKASR